MSTDITEALARLDADIVAAEARLADLRRQKDGVLAFVNNYMSVPFVVAADHGQGDESAPTDGPIRVSGSGQSAVIHDIIERRVEGDFTIEGLDQIVRSEGHDFTREQINNAVTYLKRREFVEKRPGRGNWRRASALGVSPQTSPTEPVIVGGFPLLEIGGGVS